MYAPISKPLRELSPFGTTGRDLEPGGKRAELRGLVLEDQLRLLAPDANALVSPGEQQQTPRASVSSTERTPILTPPDLASSPVAEAPSTSLVPAGQPTLRWGKRGAEVERLQSLLNRTDEVDESLGVDGIFGAKTYKAVCQFQAAHPPLLVDGVVGPNTWGQLVATEGAPQDAKAVAGKLFDRGSRAFSRGMYIHAYDFITAADEHYHLKELSFTRAQCLRIRGARRKEAIALYEQYLAEGGGDRAAEAQAHIAELRGPGPTGNDEVDKRVAGALFDKGALLFGAGDYAHAYEEFSKCDEVKHFKELSFTRAQCLRRFGARRKQAIALYEEYLAEGGGDRAGEARAAIEALSSPKPSGDPEADKVTAGKLFDEGAAAFGKGDYRHALDAFERCDELMHFKDLTFTRAQTLRLMGGRRKEAVTLFKQYLAEGGKERADEATYYIRELLEQGAIDQDRGI